MILTKASIPEFEIWRSAIETEGGVALIDKEVGWTSFDVVAKLRSLTKIKKVGHAGTLDPLATGLLIVCLGKATKSINEFQDASKKYRTVIKFGATTASLDAEFPEENVQEINEIVLSQKIPDVMKSFVGEIEQIPPMFSAIKKDGVPMYKLARKGAIIERAVRRIVIHSIEILDISLPFLTIDVHCSKGTYIRTLADDIGATLGCGAYLFSLRRTAIGNFNVENAVSVGDIYKQVIELKENIAN